MKNVIQTARLFIVLSLACILSCKNPLKTHELKEQPIDRMGGEYCIFMVKIDKDNGKLNPGDRICVSCGNASDCPQNTIYKVKVNEDGQTKRYEVAGATQGMEKKCEHCPDGVVYGYEKVK